MIPMKPTHREVTNAQRNVRFARVFLHDSHGR
jgi:hypothetical protein